MAIKPIPSSEQIKADVDATVAKFNQNVREINRKIWEHPELAFKEFYAHDTLCDAIEGLGFTVTRHAYGVETAFEVLSGSDGRLINFNAEYDALPDVGHACGHNLIATAGLTAFLALSHILKAYGIPGRVQLLGTPAEEIGGGKIVLLKAGAYNGVDAALMVHPGTQYMFAKHGPYSGAAGIRFVAKQAIYGQYKGRPAHSGGNPWNGINALDAAVQGYNNISMLRQQMHPDERVHGTICDAPQAANVVPPHTKVLWEMRAPTRKRMNALAKRVTCCLDAAGTATGCELVIEKNMPYSDLLVNQTLCERYTKYMAGYGENILTVDPDYVQASGDFGDISYALPCMHPVFGIPVKEPGIFTHHWAFTEAAGTDEAHNAAVTAGKAICMVAFDVISNDAMYETIKNDWKKAVAVAEADMD